jgi:hypothetical protein
MVWLLVVAGVLLWLLAVLPFYYVVHNPLAVYSTPPATISERSLPPIARALGSRLADLLLLGSTLVVVASWGSRTLRWLRVPVESRLERWGLGATLGLGLLGSLVLGLAAIGALYRPVAYAVLILLGVTAWREARSLLQTLVEGVRQIRLTGTCLLWFYTGAIGLLALGLSLLPPTGWDALVYHLQGPRLYLESHRLLALPRFFYLNYPSQVDMLFLWGMLLKGDILAKLFHWIFWPLTALLVYGLAKRTTSARAGAWAAALWASIPLAAGLAGLAHVDVAVSGFALAGVYCFFRWTDTASDPWLMLAAVFVGLAMASKYTAVSWLAMLGLLLVYHVRVHQKRDLRWLLGRGLGFGAVAGLIVAPWLLKNAWATGNPVYPFLFGGPYWNPTRASWLTYGGHGYSDNVLDYLALPWVITVLGAEGSPAFDGTIGPLLLCLVPLGILVRGRRRLVNYGLFLASGQLVVLGVATYVYLFMAQTRLVLPAFPLLCVAAADTLQRLAQWDRKAFRLSRVITGVAVLVMAANLFSETLAFAHTRPLFALLGLESREEYLTRTLGAHYFALRELDQRLPQDARLFFLWEPRSYYSPRPTRTDVCLDNLAQLQIDYADAETALEALTDQGFTHVLLYQSFYEYVRAPKISPATLSGFVSGSGPEELDYPLSEENVRFQQELVGRCVEIGRVLDAYTIYQLP